MKMPTPPVQTAQVRTLPAPVGGWNTRDPLEAMKLTDAVVLDNFIPAPGGLGLREGFEIITTGIPGPITALMEYAPPDTAGNKLFAANAANIFDASMPGVVATAVQAGLSNGFWQHTMAASAAGSFLWTCNGEDYARFYDGSTWATATCVSTSTASASGLLPTDIANVAVHKERIWVCKKNSLDAYFFPPASIFGKPTFFGLSSFAKKGGQLMAIGTWSRDGGSGQDDYWVAITSKGECLVYQGTDPVSNTTWSLVGVFSVPEPIGRRCLYKEGADLVILTKRGVIPLSQVIGIASSGQINKAISDKITPSFEAAGDIYGLLPGWQVYEYPNRSLFFVNVPTGLTTAVQFVMQAQTGSWCRFTNINAGVFSLFGEKLYIGMLDGSIARYGGGYTDDDIGVVARMQSAFTDMKAPGEKVFSLIRPSMQAPQGLQTQFTIKIDFDISDTPLQITPFDDTGVAWDSDEAIWDVAAWGAAIVSSSDWQAPDVIGPGHQASIAVAVQSDTLIKLSTFDLMFQRGAEL